MILLSCDFRKFRLEDEPITKRKILSLTHKIFDPIGFTCPVTLVPKIILQECWKIKVSWDTKLPENIVKMFKKFKNRIIELKKIAIPRRLSRFSFKQGKMSIHVFYDACKTSYATCIFLRNEFQGQVTCQLLQARSRVAPLKNITIVRLEFLACCIGARLADTVKKDLKLEDADVFYWSDSMDALHWIKKEGPWKTFVENSVKEIRKLSEVTSWKFVPGHQNPADLPSRGCNAEELVKSQWWERPSWLY
ncbi:reverse transcriptase [Caerostris extrusa]|uniref:Reverse transcriptase n=1 Tax=Caerostris extrusa TaxID=172846 RepID=A0AAV4Y4G9_CAEEX|nr:reverse transcriptase [Caerostris extrusa]